MEVTQIIREGMEGDNNIVINSHFTICKVTTSLVGCCKITIVQTPRASPRESRRMLCHCWPHRNTQRRMSHNCLHLAHGHKSGGARVAMRLPRCITSWGGTSCAHIRQENRVAERKFEATNSWDSIRVKVIPGKRHIDLYLNHDSQRCKLEVFFEHIRNCYKCGFVGPTDILLQVSCSPFCSNTSISFLFT